MKKKKFDINQRKIDFFTGGKPCVPGRVRFMSKEEIERFKEHFEEAKKLGKVVTLEKNQKVTEHGYLDHMIKENELIENYEECARLLKIKNETPYSEELTRVISLL
jgi:hypothetical protein